MNGQTQKTATNPTSTVAENLEAGAATFRERDAVYGPSYIRFGQVMDGLFPEGLHIQKGDINSHIRLGVFVQLISKMTRYAETLQDGGHEDCAHDIMVYGAILESVTLQFPILNDHAQT